MPVRSLLQLHFIPGATLALTRQPALSSAADPLMYEWPHSSTTEADDGTSSQVLGTLIVISPPSRATHFF